MKKGIIALCLVLTLCCASAIAFADTHPVDDNGKYIHTFTPTADTAAVTVWPSTSNKTGLIRFYCDYAGEYEDDATSTVPAAVDFQEYVVQPYYTDF